MSTPTAPHRRSGGLGFVLLLVLMVALPFGEVFLLVRVGQLIGVWWTLAILLGEAVLGAWLVRRAGSRAWTALNGALASGKMPAGELTDTAFILVGGVFLVLPGFLTDAVGLLFLLPVTRPLARKVLAWLVARRVSRLGLSTAYVRRDATIIEGETVPDAQKHGGPGSSSSGPVIISGEIEERQA
jgi:UPF0716 protein FxsA